MKKNSCATMIMAAVVIVGVSGAASASQFSDHIESAAKKSYVYTNYLKGDDITIKVSNDSVVTLTGTVAAWSHRPLAEDAVAGLRGVKKVNNNLQVKGEQPAENSDGWIGIKVKTVLLFHRNVSGIKTDVDVKEGVVTLRGEASSEAQKDLTTEYAKDVDGVKSVNNVMTLEKTAQTTVEKVGDFVDDASITTQAKFALLFHRSTSAIKTKVETNDGRVTVSGEAKNSAERDLVAKLVNDIKGVKSVNNQMTIAVSSAK
jgi:hyperosmotically inducible protein